MLSFWNRITLGFWQYNDSIIKLMNKIYYLGVSVWLIWLKCLTLDFGSSHDLVIHEIKPCIGSTEPAWDSLSLPHSLPIPCVHALSLSLSLSLSLKMNK